NPQSLGAYYTTYILWAVAPEGQTENLMELPINTKFKIESTTNFQTFGLMITAEPHSRVELPGPVIVAENTLRNGTEGEISTSRIEYSGDPGTLYFVSSPNAPSLNADYNTPLLILGARRAVEIAQRSDAQRFAEPELREAEVKLEVLERSWPLSRKTSDLRKNAKKYGGLARDTMRLAENARSLAIKRSAQARLDSERLEASNTIAEAQSEAERLRIQAERSAILTGIARNDADRARTEAERARKEQHESLMLAAREATIARQQVEQAQSEADRSRLQAEEARRDRDATRQQLYVSLSAILETRREARGLIVNLSDVLFDSGQATLKSGAREKLSKLAGILVAYPGVYRIEIEGHTDSVGSDERNRKLSQGRAASVRAYLMQGGVHSDRMMAAQGFGESKPVASNETASGRQVNRRVEIIIEDSDQQVKTGKN
ncbi:MAG TPA: OmpA family protein, partial [Blastocatellia bacterium]|nr:OmpA family protein [Blastocatellia bacterium]